MGIRFKFNAQKAEQAIAWLVAHCPNPTKHKLSKILFFADKAHLNKYGRPVLGDEYVAMRFGPVPSSVLNMINGEHPKADGEEYPFELHGNSLMLRAGAHFDTDQLSPSDIEELQAAVEEYGSLTFGQLTDISHDDPAWIKASHWMDYADFIEDSDAKDEIIEHLEETADLVVV